MLEDCPMAAPNSSAQPDVSLAALQNAFLKVLPQLERYGRVVFGHLPPSKLEESVQEMRSLAWRRFLRLAEVGKDASVFVGKFLTLVARSVRSGRRMCGQEPDQDVLSWLAQRRHGFSVQRLPIAGSNAWDEALFANTESEVLDQVVFRIDFPRWRSMLTSRDRRLVDRLMLGEPASHVARRFGLSPGRITQLRQGLRDDWLRFEGELENAQEGSQAAVA
jgi:hypothetical protein